MTRHSKMRGSYVRFLLVMAFSSIHDFDMGDFSRILASHRSLSMRPRARRGPIRPFGNCEAVPNIIASAAARGSKQHLERGRPAARKADELAPPHGAFPSGQTPGGLRLSHSGAASVVIRRLRGRDPALPGASA